MSNHRRGGGIGGEAANVVGIAVRDDDGVDRLGRGLGDLGQGGPRIGHADLCVEDDDALVANDEARLATPPLSQ
nr:hypothetical protein [Sphingomonas bacterium]